MEKRNTPTEEGGIVAYAQLDSDEIKLEYILEKINPCPECGTEMIINGRCKTCPNCGWSTCSI